MQAVNLAAVEPTRTISAETDAATKVVDQAGLDIKYQEELRRHLDRKDALREGLNKAYALIYTNYCTKMMQARIEEHPDYNFFKNNPIAVLEAIKTLMHDPVRAQYPMALMTDALGRLVNVKQQDTESLLDYIKRFKQLRDVVKSQMGNKFLTEFIEHLPTYTTALATDQALMQTEAYSKWMAYLLIRGSDQTKYGSLTKGFISQYSLGNDQYPKTITTATDVLSNHKLDQRYWDNQKKNRDRSRDKRNHNQYEAGNATSFAQHEHEMTCYCCGKKGHLSTTCDKRNAIPREQWHVNKAMQHLQGNNGTNADDDKDTEELTNDDESILTSRSTSSQNRRSGIPRQSRKQSREMVTWSGFQFQQEDNSKQQSNSPFEHLKDVILLDTGSIHKPPKHQYQWQQTLVQRE
jgi:hypothetical protein